jgi:hypothetical protein
MPSSSSVRQGAAAQASRVMVQNADADVELSFGKAAAGGIFGGGKEAPLRPVDFADRFMDKVRLG